jgi:hypothetical protein
MKIDKFIFWCVPCGCEHTVDADEIPCPEERERLEQRVKTLQSENDRLTEELDLFRDAAKRVNAGFDVIIKGIQNLIAPATPQA